jgi:LPS-assembly protein
MGACHLLRQPHFRQKAGNDLVQDALQCGGIQTSYSWDCCGIAFEYRRPAVGVTNQNEKYFSSTLAGVGAAGNLKHSERIF